MSAYMFFFFRFFLHQRKGKAAPDLCLSLRIVQLDHLLGGIDTNALGYILRQGLYSGGHQQPHFTSSLLIGTDP